MKPEKYTFGGSMSELGYFLGGFATGFIGLAGMAIWVNPDSLSRKDETIKLILIYLGVIFSSSIISRENTGFFLGGVGMCLIVFIVMAMFIHKDDLINDISQRRIQKHKERDNNQDQELLKQSFITFSEQHTFVPGDIVEWKPGMSNKLAKGPFIVVAVLDEPNFGTDPETGSQYFREPLDIICGHIRDDKFLCYHYDSRRFRPHWGYGMN
jgi:hypothetical protein